MRNMRPPPRKRSVNKCDYESGARHSRRGDQLVSGSLSDGMPDSVIADPAMCVLALSIVTAYVTAPASVTAAAPAKVRRGEIVQSQPPSRDAGKTAKPRTR